MNNQYFHKWVAEFNVQGKYYCISLYSYCMADTKDLVEMVFGEVEWIDIRPY